MLNLVCRTHRSSFRITCQLITVIRGCQRPPFDRTHDQVCATPGSRESIYAVAKVHQNLNAASHIGGILIGPNDSIPPRGTVWHTPRTELAKDLQALLGRGDVPCGTAGWIGPTVAEAK